MEKTRRWSPVFALMLCSLCGAAEPGPLPQGVVVQPGDPVDCPDSPARTPSGSWFALERHGSRWFLAPTKVQIAGGAYRSTAPAVYLIDLPHELTKGPLNSAQIVPQGVDSAFSFEGRNYRWVQVSGTQYFLADGHTSWNNERAYFRMSGQQPRAVGPRSPAPRCGTGECHELEWAGDLNRDGQLDLIVRFAEGEDAGRAIWLGRKTQEGLVFETGARTLFDSLSNFTCAFGKMRSKLEPG